MRSFTHAGVRNDIMNVVYTETSQILATRLARALTLPLVDMKYSRFPDGELYLMAGETGDETVIVGSVVDNNALVQLLLLIDTCEGSRNHLVLPYMAYARQDKQFKPGEPLSARAVARAIGRGVETIYTVNIHEPEILKYFPAPAQNLSLAPDIGAYIGTLDLDNPLILAPDEGALAFAGQVASAGGWEFDHLEKTRLSGTEVRMAPRQLSAAGRQVIIVDDIISTGGTIVTAAGMLYQQGATDIYAACVHGVLTGGAYARLMATGIRNVICSDTIERACSKVSAADRIAGAIRTR